MLNYLLLLFNFLITLQSNDKLIFVMTHFRHGARAPSSLTEKVDKVGEIGENSNALTGTGERMLYILGLRNRIKYINENKFLSEKYNSSELEVISSNSQRAVISLSSYLQGLYPQSEKAGKNLTESQLTKSDPPLDVDNPRIKQEKKELDNSALPNFMTLIPFQTIDLLGINDCLRASLISGGPNSPYNLSIFNLLEEYRENYEYIGQFKVNTSKYPLKNIYDLCDSFVSSYTDGRNMDIIRNKGVNIEKFYDYCLRVFNVVYGEIIIYGNMGNETVYIQASYFMELLVNYSKSKIEEDMAEKNVNNSKKSSISQKMLILSGHDMTVSEQELFLIFAFNKTLDLYRYPTFGAQLSFEITRKDDNKNKRQYSDYFINYYFNNELLLNMTVEEFLNKVEPHIWPNEKINLVCSTKGNTTDINNKDVIINKNLLYVFTSVFAISLLMNILNIFKIT